MDLALDPAVDAAVRELAEPGAEAFRTGVTGAAANLVPNPPVDIVDWCRDHLTLPTALSQRSGPLVLSPMQAAIARKWQQPGIRQVTFLKPPRFGSSLLNAAGLLYFAGHEGVDVLFYERTEGDAQDFHDKKLYPIMTESEDLQGLLRPDSRSGVQDAWMDRILTTGASVQLRGVMTNGSMRAVKGRFIAVDEASSQEFQAGTKGDKGEGSKLALIKRRAQEFFDPVVYVGGTPTVEGACLVSEEWAKGDRCEFRMPSPCCPDEPQVFLDDIQRVENRGERRGPGLRYTCDPVTDRPNDVWYECAHCGGAVEETSKVLMMEGGELVPTNLQGEEGHCSVWGWAGYSTDPQSTWLDIAVSDQAAMRDPEQRQPHMNLVRARVWKPEGPGHHDPHVLAERCEDYGPHLPDGVMWIFVGMDTQEGGRNGLPRHELVFVGYGANEESWILDRVVVDGVEVVTPDGEIVRETTGFEPFSPDAARAIWAALDREWRKADGTVVPVETVAVDVGYDMNRALRFCHQRESKRRKIVAVKGRREAHGSRMPVITKRPSVAKSGYEFNPVGTQSAKDTVFRRLGYAVGQPESIHAPLHLGDGSGFWEQVAAETLQSDDKGRTWWDVTKPGTPNEALDCLVYAYAAFCLRKARSRRVREAVAIRLEAAAAPVSAITDSPVAWNGSRSLEQAESREAAAPRPGVRRLSGGSGPLGGIPVPATEQPKSRRFGAIGTGMAGWG